MIEVIQIGLMEDLPEPDMHWFDRYILNLDMGY